MGSKCSKRFLNQLKPCVKIVFTCFNLVAILFPSIGGTARRFGHMAINFHIMDHTIDGNDIATKLKQFFPFKIYEI